MSNHWHTRFQDENFVYGTEPNVFLSEIQKKLQLSGDALAIAEGEAELEWKNLLMDVPSSAMGDRIFNTGDEVCFHINEKNAVKIADER